jgi:hypothetical protein
MSTVTSTHINNCLFMGTWEHLKIGGSPPGIMPQGSCAGGDPSKYTEKYKSSHIFGSIEDA